MLNLFLFLFKKFFNHYLKAHFNMRHILLSLHNEVCSDEPHIRLILAIVLSSDFREPLSVYVCMVIYII